MTDFTLLDQLLESPNTASSSEEVVEEYFDEIVNYIEQEKTDEAAKLIEKVFGKGAPDIRLIVYYFYSHFTNHGIKSFMEIFPLITSIVNEYWDVLLPIKRKEKHLESSLNWFFSHLLLRIKHFEKHQAAGKIDPVWKKSTVDISAEEFDQLSTVSNEFRNFILEKWPKSPIKDRVMHLIKKIDELKPITPIETTPPESDVSENIVEEVQEEVSDPVEIVIPAVIEEIQEVVEQVPVEESIESEIVEDSPVLEKAIETDPQEECSSEIHKEETSREVKAEESKEEDTCLKEVTREEFVFLTKLDDFSLKLKVFESLIGRNDYLKAAVVAKDIDYLIETFDPLSYFPKIFAKYFFLFAKHVSALAEQYEKKESLQVKALEKLYRTDLDMFVEW